MSQAVMFIASDSGRFVQLCVERFSVFWLGERDRGDQFDGLRRLTLLLPLPFVVVGLLIGCYRRMPMLPLLAVLVFVPAVYYLTHVTHRYRHPIEPCVIALAAFGLCHVLVGTKSMIQVMFASK